MSYVNSIREYDGNDYSPEAKIQLRSAYDDKIKHYGMFRDIYVLRKTRDMRDKVYGIITDEQENAIRFVCAYAIIKLYCLL